MAGRRLGSPIRSSPTGLSVASRGKAGPCCDRATPMTLLVLATALFAGIHLLVSGTALRGAIKPVVKGSKARVPVASGDLKRSLIGKASVTRDGKGEARVIARSTKGFQGWRAHLIELGTSRQSAQPYMRPAFDAALQGGDILGGFFTAINKTIAKRLKKDRIALGKEEDVEG